MNAIFIESISLANFLGAIYFFFLFGVTQITTLRILLVSKIIKLNLKQGGIPILLNHIILNKCAKYWIHSFGRNILWNFHCVNYVCFPRKHRFNTINFSLNIWTYILLLATVRHKEFENVVCIWDEQKLLLVPIKDLASIGESPFVQVLISVAALKTAKLT